MSHQNPDAREDPAMELRARVEAAVGSQYRVVRLLGQGGMGAVFLAREEALDRLVAIKVLPQGRGDAESRERFRREARLAAQLTHPNIVPLLGFGELSGILYLVMGYVQGESLGQRLKRDVRLAPEEIRRILADVAEALDYAHRRGVVHRDIKPDNILIDDETGRALLADFGIARGTAEEDALTRQGDVIGTPQYMSPEQARGAPVDGRSDLYSLGIVAFAMLTGRTPFQGGTPQEALVRRLTVDAPPILTVAPTTSPELASLIDRCLLRDPASRFPDARAFRLAIAPPSLDDEQLPEPLDVLDGAGVTLTLGVLVALAVTTYAAVPAYEGWAHHMTHDHSRALAVIDGLLQPPILIPLGLWALLALRLQLPIAAARSARAHGFSWSDIRFAFLRQPRGWMALWYPRTYRRKDDAWSRLPQPFRRARIMASIGAAAAVALFFLVLSMPPLEVAMEGLLMAYNAGVWSKDTVVGSILWHFRALFVWPVLGSVITLGVAVIGWAQAAFVGVRSLRAQHREKFLEHRASRALLFGPTADRTAWKQAGLASFLLSPNAAASDRPSSPADFPVAMARVASPLTGEARTAADAAIETARRLANEIAHIEQRIPRMERDADIEEAERLDRRINALGIPESEDQKAMTELLRQQREILRRAAVRLDEARAHRARAGDFLNTLWAGTTSLTQGGAAARLHASLRQIDASLGGNETSETQAFPRD